MLSCVQDLSKIPSVKGGNAVKICAEDKGVDVTRGLSEGPGSRFGAGGR